MPDPLDEAGRASWKRWQLNSALKYFEMQKTVVGESKVAEMGSSFGLGYGL